MGSFKDLTGQKFGRLTVLEKTEQRKQGSVVWKCKCECGNITYVCANKLKQGHSTSCGCYARKKLIERNKPKDLTSMKFGKLTALETTNKRDSTFVVWKCKCDCGNITYVNSNNLQRGTTKSCGCLNSYNASKNAPKNLEKFKNENYVDGTRLDIINSTSINKNNKSGYKGVSLRKKDNKYIARIEFQGKRYFLGSYDTKEDAAKARKEAEKKLYTDFLEVHKK